MATTVCSLPMTGMQPWSLSTWLQSIGLEVYMRVLARFWQSITSGIRCADLTAINAFPADPDFSYLMHS